MTDLDSSRRESSRRGYPIIAAGVILLIGVGLAWRLLDGTAEPSAPDGSALNPNPDPVIAMVDADPNPSRTPQQDEFIGHSSNQQQTEYERCDAKARSEMSALIVRVDEGEVVVREIVWDAKSTATRVGIASWLSECTQDNRPVTIFGDESSHALATYDRRTGYGSLRSID